MNSKQLLDAIGSIDDLYVEEADKPTVLPLKVWMPAVAFAACVLLTVSLLPWKTMFSGSNPSVNDPTDTDKIVNVLQNDDTTHSDTTKENDDSSVNTPNNNENPDTDDTTHSNTQNVLPIPDTGAPETNTITVPDTVIPNGTEKTPAETKEPIEEVNPTPETKEPAVTVKPIPETKEPAVTVSPTPETKEPAVTVKPIPETKEPAVTVSPTPDTIEPNQNVKPTPNTTGPNSNISPTPDTTSPAQSTRPTPDTTDSPEFSDIEDTSAFEEETTPPLTPVVPIPQYPTILSRFDYPVQDQYPAELSLRPQWRNAKSARVSYYQSGIGDTDSFMYWTVREFFSNSGSDNLVYSPANAYMTLGMLAETAGGNTQAQLLRLLGENDVYSLRSSASNLWNSCYRDDGIVTTVLGNSMWLDNSFVPKTAMTNILAENYYASSFWGNMGDEAYDALMRSWLNEQTKGFLGEEVSNISLDPQSTMSLMSTVYFKANWAVKFETESTRNRVFHSPEGDVTAQYMYRDFVGLRYVGENFETTYLDLEEGGKMWFILPDEDVSMQSLFKDSEAMGFITGKTQKTLNYDEYSAYMWLFVPKFDINSGIDLKDSLQRIGVTDVFDSYNADFSALTDSNIFLRGITQSARICIDENGCEAAALSGGTVPGEGSNETFGFMLNRPFIFVVTSDSGVPVFVGTVNRPN